MSDPISFKAALAEICALACAGIVFVATALESPWPAADDESPAGAMVER
jgi:hypothetical protein